MKNFNLLVLKMKYSSPSCNIKAKRYSWISIRWIKISMLFLQRMETSIDFKLITLSTKETIRRLCIFTTKDCWSMSPSTLYAFSRSPIISGRGFRPFALSTSESQKYYSSNTIRSSMFPRTETPRKSSYSKPNRQASENSKLSKKLIH